MRAMWRVGARTESRASALYSVDHRPILKDRAQCPGAMVRLIDPGPLTKGNGAQPSMKRTTQGKNGSLLAGIEMGTGSSAAACRASTRRDPVVRALAGVSLHYLRQCKASKAASRAQLNGPVSLEGTFA